ncbi:MAG: NADH-quinone oxidoreductase subunit J [Phycisphaerales bacterium]|jgi:NADH-quinone oxidoreductase subunit J
MPSTPPLPLTLLEADSLASPALLLTIAAAISAAGLALLMVPGKRGLRLAGTVIGLAGFAMFFVEVLKRATVLGEPAGFPPVFPVVFGFLAVVGAVRMVTHPRPVFAALYFILVVIATAGMFLLLGAEFMAFALVIVYAGAILITYMFVLMLAQQSPADGGGDAWYDRMPREPLSAIVIGFVILTVLANAYFNPSAQSARLDTMATSTAVGEIRAWERLEGMPKLLLETARRAYADSSAGAATVESVESFDAAGATVTAKLSDGTTTAFQLPPAYAPDNGRQVGVDLVSKFPAGLEIAGVVLLMALFGAVILARRQIELGEDERRGLAGMRRLTVDGEAGGSGGVA